MKLFFRALVLCGFVFAASFSACISSWNVKQLQKAAEQGDAEAQFNLGRYYLFGKGVEKDEKEAVKWLRKSAEQGVAKAQYNLGVLYANGDSVPQNNAKAVDWLRKAAEQGDDKAQFVLNDLHRRINGGIW